MLYVFYGPDSFQRREALAEMKRNLDTDSMLETNTVVLAARECSPQEVMAAADTVPFLASHRLVIVEGVLQAASARGRRSRKAEAVARPEVASPWQALAEYVERMPPTTTLVLVDDEVPEGSALIEALSKKGKVRKFDAPHPKRELPGWIQRRAQKLGLRIDARAVRLLADLIGSDTWLLANELDKLAAYAAGQPVREEDVRALVSAAREQKGWALADAVVEGRAAAAVRLLHELLDQGDHPLALLSTIQTAYRRLAIARELLDSGAGDSAIGARTGRTGFGLERLIEQASRHSAAKLRVAYARLVEADADIKRGVYSDEESLELLVQDLAAQAASKAA